MKEARDTGGAAGAFLGVPSAFQALPVFKNMLNLMPRPPLPLEGLEHSSRSIVGGLCCT
jgi:hypothetical protein